MGRLERCIVIAGLLFMLAFPACAADKDREQMSFSKQPEIEQAKPKKPVKIKLKRSAKDDYTWELTGDDVDEIIRTDKRLRKQLNVP